MDADVVVVGGGFVGLFTAYRLHKSGFRVVVVGGDGPRLGASWGNAGLIHQGSTTTVPEILGFWRVVRLALRRGSYISSNPKVVLRESLPGGWIWRYARSLKREQHIRREAVLTDLAREGKSVWLETIRSEGLDVELLERGSLEAFFSEELFNLEARVVAEEASRLGYRVQLLSGEDCREMEPLLKGEVAGGIYYPEDVWLNPSKALESLVSILKRLGVEVAWVKANTLGAGGDGVRVEAGGRLLRAERAVLAAGAWIGNILKSLRLKIPLIAGRGYLAVSEPVNERLSRPIFYADEKIVVSQTAGGNLRFTSYFELNDPDAPLDHSKIIQMTRKVKNAINISEDPRIVDEWVGSRPCLPDGLPVVGSVGVDGRIIVAAGHCRLGLTLAPATARLVEDIITGRESPALRHFSPARFS